MAWALGIIDISLEASADLSAKQFYFVKMSADNKCTVCAAETDIPIGVLQNAPASGETASVRVMGITKVSANGTIAYGELCGTSGDGQCKSKTVGTESDEYISGIVIDGVTTAAEIATIAINCANPARAK